MVLITIGAHPFFPLPDFILLDLLNFALAAGNSHIILVVHRLLKLHDVLGEFSTILNPKYRVPAKVRMFASKIITKSLSPFFPTLLRGKMWLADAGFRMKPYFILANRIDT